MSNTSTNDELWMPFGESARCDDGIWPVEIACCDDGDVDVLSVGTIYGQTKVIAEQRRRNIIGSP